MDCYVIYCYTYIIHHSTASSFFLIRSRYFEKREQNDRPLSGEAEGEEKRNSFIVGQKNEGFPPGVACFRSAIPAAD